MQTGAALVALPLAAFSLWRSRQMAVRLERHSDSLRKLREAAAAGQVLQGRHDELLRRLEGHHTRLSSLEGRLEDLLGAERDLAAQLAALRETMEPEHGPRGPDTQAVTDPATEEWERQLEQCLSALHSGDRAYLRSCGAREMNLTQASKEDLAVGTDTPPRLEPVDGGGSYLLLSLGERHWLLPTESTLDGFRHPLTRPRRGIFTTTGAADVDRPRVRRPACLEPDGSQWVLTQPGVVECPDPWLPGRQGGPPGA